MGKTTYLITTEEPIDRCWKYAENGNCPFAYINYEGRGECYCHHPNRNENISNEVPELEVEIDMDPASISPAGPSGNYYPKPEWCPLVEITMGVDLANGDDRSASKGG